MTLANYLDPQKFDITVYDEGIGQATKASAGIISLGYPNVEIRNGTN